jgi:hypothetical protein
MNYKKLPTLIRTVVTAVLMCCGCLLLAQTSFSVSDTLVIIDKNTSSPVVYDYSSIYNDTDEDLEMRWIKRIDMPFDPAWVPAFQDPSTWHNPLEPVDSADFLLSVDSLFTNKLIFQIAHNQEVGFGQASFLVFPVNDRSDTVRITYRALVSADPLSTKDQDSDNGVVLYPNPCDGVFSIKGMDVSRIEVYTLSGNFAHTAAKSQEQWDVSHLPNGSYLIKLYDMGGVFIERRLLIAK